MNLAEISNQLKVLEENIILIYAFNAVGKTRLSVAYKDATKDPENNQHAGVYYNAFSEDIFVWDNDDDNDNANMRFQVRQSSLSKYHNSLGENNVREKLRPYKPHYDFRFTLYDDAEKGIESISFFIPDPSSEVEPLIKISRGEERVFIWCFFLALLEVDGWANQQNAYIFIDDPVTSLDDHNLFITAYTIYNLIKSQFENKKIIITTHHVGLFSFLFDCLLKGEKAGKFKRHTKSFILSGKRGDLSLENCKKDVFLYHLRLLQMLKHAQDDGAVKAYHFVLLRQVLENVASFLGTGRVGHVLTEIGVSEPDNNAQILNTLSHKNIYFYESDELVEDNKALFKEILEKLLSKYGFVLHAD